METIKESSERIANSIMPFILLGIDHSAKDEVRNSIANAIESFVTSEVSKKLGLVNGLKSYSETFWTLADNLVNDINKGKDSLQALQDDNGRMVFSELLQEWALEFEKKNEGRQWDGQFFEEIDEFYCEKLRGL